MVGDRRHDGGGAAAHDISCIGAGWGYGQPGELVAAGAVEVFATPRDLLAAHDRAARCFGCDAWRLICTVRSARVVTPASLRWLVRNRALTRRGIWSGTGAFYGFDWRIRT